jgi:hypothetical protein
MAANAPCATFVGSNGQQHPTKEGWATIRGELVWVEPSNKQYPSGDIDFPDFNSQVHVDDAVNKIRSASVSRKAWIQVDGRRIQR